MLVLSNFGSRPRTFHFKTVKISSLVPKKGTTGGQKRLTAETAAKVVAQRRLVEMLEGVAVVSETTIKDS